MSARRFHHHQGRMSGASCICRQLWLPRGRVLVQRSLGLESKAAGWTESTEKPSHRAQCSGQSRGAGVRGPSRDWQAAARLCKLRHSWELPLANGSGRGGPQPVHQSHLLSPSPTSQAGLGGVGRRPFPGRPAGCRGQMGSPGLLLSPSSKPSTRQTAVKHHFLSSSALLKHQRAPSSSRPCAILPNECVSPVTHTQDTGICSESAQCQTPIQAQT